MLPRAIAYMNPWHLKRSSAFRSLLLDALPSIAFEQRSILGYQPGETTSPVVFCLDLPKGGLPPSVQTPHTWIPMIDGYGGSESTWSQLPEYLRIVSFSNQTDALARKTGHPLCRVRFFANPGEGPTHSKAGVRTLFYWNRTHLFELPVLLKMCDAMNVERLLLRHYPDPHLGDGTYARLPDSVGFTSIQIMPSVMSRAEHLECLRQAHVYVAPRHTEGVGVAFIEAMAQGCAIIALNNYTMNEYVTHLESGFILPYDVERTRRNVMAIQQRRMLDGTVLDRCRILRLKMLGRLSRYESHVRQEELPVNELASADWERMGVRARAISACGYEAWRESLARYAEFLLSA